MDAYNAAIHAMLVSLMFAFPFEDAADLSSDRAALMSFRLAVDGGFLLWNVSESLPCSWIGVVCGGGRVTELRLPGKGLSGEIPVGVFGNLTGLRTLSLRFNAISGKVPSDIASCTDLHNIYLQGNLFSGNIPASLFSLLNIVRLDLSGNGFIGEIPTGFTNLTRLRTLYLENNHLTGRIPDLRLPGLIQFNVSSNRLNGSVPSSLSRMPRSAFVGNSLCGVPLSTCPNNVTRNESKKLSGAAIAGIVIGSVVGLLVVLAILLFLSRRKNSDRTRSVNTVPVEHENSGQKSDAREGDALRSSVNSVESFPTGGSKKGGGDGKGLVGGEGKSLVFLGSAERVFDLGGLLRASAEVLGKGTFGTTYKATLEVGIVVAVKRLKDVSISEKEFGEKMQALGMLDHENLVPLRAYYYNNDEKLLVYDYMPMGSFSSLLHGIKGAGGSPLNWETRSNIALGASRGITYLHSQTPTTSHGDIKSSNILITNTYETRLSDSRLATILTPSSMTNRATGYRAPEVTDLHRVSQKADVYSFGVFLLELLTGKPPFNEGEDLPRWVQSVVREEWTSEVFDIELLRCDKEEEMVEFLQLALDCTTHYPDSRPPMREVTRRIEELVGGSRSRDLNDHQFIVRSYSIDSGAPPPVMD